MRSYRSYVFKVITGQRVTSLLILLAVIASTMMTTVIGQSVGVLSAMRQQQAIAIGGDRYVTLLQMDEEQTTVLENDPRLSFAGRSVTLGTAELNALLSLGLTEYQGNTAEIYPTFSVLKEGKLPENPMEIALPENVLRYLADGKQIGDHIHLELSKALRHGIEAESFDFAADFVLVGIMEDNYLNYTGGLVKGIVGEGSAGALLPEEYLYYNVDIRTAERKDFRETVEDLVGALQVHELDVLYNVPYLEALGIDPGADGGGTEVSGSAEGFSLLEAAGVMIGALFLLAAGLVVVNILKIDTARRIREYGVLRAIGAEEGQLYLLVFLQIALLCVPGIPAGLLAGALSAEGILKAATGLLSPEIFLVRDAAELGRLIEENSSGSWAYLAVSAGVTLWALLAAALPAARYAAKTSPVLAMEERKTRIRRRYRRVKDIRHFERYCAGLNLRRNTGRTALTVLSLVMSIAVFIVLQGSVSLFNTAGTVGEHMGDYSIINEQGGFSPQELLELSADGQVSSVAAFQFSLYDIDGDGCPVGIAFEGRLKPGETFQVIGMNKEYMEAGLSDCLSGEALEKLEAGEGCVVRNPLPLIFDGEEIPRTEIHAGENIVVAGEELSVLHTLDGYERYFSTGNNGFVNGVQVLVSESLYTGLTEKVNYSELLPSLEEGADREAFDKKMKALAGRVPGTTWLSYEDTDRQLAESFEQIRLLAWGIILFVGLIGLLNIVNTTYTNIHTRIAEIGIQRAVGMSVGSLYRVFLWESAYMGIAASLIGVAAGYLCLLLVDAGAEGAFRWIALPFLPAAEASLLSIGACLLAGFVPLQRMGRRSIVEAVESPE